MLMLQVVKPRGNNCTTFSSYVLFIAFLSVLLYQFGFLHVYYRLLYSGEQDLGQLFFDNTV
jgi:hypothetical protein